MPVKQALSSKPVGEKDVAQALNREVIPVLRAAREAINVMSAVTSASSGTYALDDYECYVELDGTFSVLLPSAAGRAGKEYVLKNVGTGIITILTSNSETVDQHASGGYTLASQWVVDRFRSNGENWRIV